MQTLAPPPHLSTFEGLEADASTGSLDIMALATVSTPGSSPAFFDTQVMPAVRSLQVTGSPWRVAQPGSSRIRPGMDRPDGRCLGGSGDKDRDRDELACRGGTYEGVKDLVIAEHRWEGVGPAPVI